MEASEFFQPPADHFIVEDLLDFPNDDALINDAPYFNSAHSTDSSTVTALHSSNSSTLSGPELNFAADIACRSFAGDLCVPYDDLAELEWLSNFAEESFSSEDLQKLQLISGLKTRPNVSSDTCGFRPQLPNVVDSRDNNPVFHPDMTVPAKARSKRSRSAPCNWASRLLVLSPTTSSSEPDIVVPVQSPPQNHPGKKPIKTASSKNKEAGEASSDGRKCMHCATDKTPQWRTGPMGPKTLCNACGVRYKSGRLVPEYRPAASPTFVLSKHSNSHRKVLELRRQKEMARAQHQHQNMVFDVSKGDDYLIHQPVGHDFRQLI
ncbi:GATA transcription factor 12 [Hibiscus trionum]|uniref:GATA transcription factor n=1 Tax=Hibiscus trionum TaxID=183268 RepID=A0A9W7M2U4_HIBTR|nr:GATA transcription factor 12 [Hibiscus trionum]